MKRSIHWILIITLFASLLPMPLGALQAGESEPSSSTEVEAEPASDSPPNTQSMPEEVSEPTINEQPTIEEPVTNSSPHISTFSTTSLTALQQEGMAITQLQTRGADGNAANEMIELYNNSDQIIDVTDWCLKRASATGASYSTLGCLIAEKAGKEHRVAVPARSYVLAVSTVNPMIADLRFASGLSDTGGRIGLFNQREERQDLVGWGTGTVEAETVPITTLPPGGSLLQRKSLGAEEYQDSNNNQADFEVATPRSSYEYGALSEEIDMCLNVTGWQATVPVGWSRDSASGDCSDIPVNMCTGLVLSEIGANNSSQFIEVYNSGDAPLNVTDCKVQTNRSNAQYVFTDQIIAPHSFAAITISGSGLTLTKTTSGTVYLLSSDGTIELQSVFYEDLDKDTSWTWFGGSDWRQTYIITPGSPNIYQQYASCEDGYRRNATTGRCNKIELVSMASPCKEGQYRSEETNRCRSIASEVASVLKPCGDDQFRNPTTNRCKKIASADDVTDCGEGRERNPTTNRCRNVVQSDVPAAAFAVEPVKDSATAFVGWWALGGVATLAIGYAGWEWRKEILGIIQKATSFTRSKP